MLDSRSGSRASRSRRMRPGACRKPLSTAVDAGSGSDAPKLTSVTFSLKRSWNSFAMPGHLKPLLSETSSSISVRLVGRCVRINFALASASSFLRSSSASRLVLLSSSRLSGEPGPLAKRSSVSALSLRSSSLMEAEARTATTAAESISRVRSEVVARWRPTRRRLCSPRQYSSVETMVKRASTSSVASARTVEYSPSCSPLSVRANAGSSFAYNRLHRMPYRCRPTLIGSVACAAAASPSFTAALRALPKRTGDA